MEIRPRTRSYYTVMSQAHGEGPTFEEREEADEWINSPDGIRGAKVIVRRLTRKEFLSLPEFPGW